MAEHVGAELTRGSKISQSLSLTVDVNADLSVTIFNGINFFNRD